MIRPRKALFSKKPEAWVKNRAGVHFTSEAGEEAIQVRNVFAASSVFSVLACVRTLFTTWAPLASKHKVGAYLGVQAVKAIKLLYSCRLII